MIYPLKNNKAACKIPPINAPKKTFFVVFLPKTFYMTHCETYRKKVSLKKHSEPSQNSFFFHFVIL